MFRLFILHGDLELLGNYLLASSNLINHLVVTANTAINGGDNLQPHGPDSLSCGLSVAIVGRSSLVVVVVANRHNPVYEFWA